MSKKTFDEQIERARKAGEEANRTEARAASASYDRESKRIVIQLVNGGEFSFPTAWVSRLREAGDEDLAAVEITPSGEGLHWDKLDEDLSVPALINGMYGPDGYNSGVFDRLAAELEAAWFAEHDPLVVDRIASQNPLYASYLYEIFSFLVQHEVNSGERSEREVTAIREWLDGHGIEQIRRMAAELKGQTRTLTTPDPIPPPPETRSETITSEQPDTKPIGKLLTFPDLLGAYAKIEPHEAFAEIEINDDFLYVLGDQPAEAQLDIRTEIADRAFRRYGVPRDRSLASLRSQLPKAARDRSTGPGPSFREQLKDLEFTDEQLELWLSLADKEE